MADKNVSSKVYNNIKEMLITLTFPPGSSLSEQALADLLGVSRTPVREALQRLSHEGWVQIGDRKRISVSPVTAADVEELFHLRFLLEPWAIQESVSKGRARALAAKLDEIQEEMRGVQDRPAIARLDMQFHSIIMKNVENRRLDRFWKTLFEETLRIAVMNYMDVGRYRHVIEEHARVVEAFWSKDLDAIQQAMRDHLAESRDALLFRLSEAGGSFVACIDQESSMVEDHESQAGTGRQ